MTFTARVKVTFRTTVSVEADSAKEAAAKLNRGEWDDDGMDVAERVDWDVGALEECE